MSACRPSFQDLEARLLLAATANSIDLVTSGLSSLSSEYATFKKAGKSSGFRSGNHGLQINDNRVAIEAAAEDVDALSQSLRALHARQIRVAAHLVSGWLPIGRVDQLSSFPGLRFARPVLFTTHVGATTSQGDASMRADIARSTYSFTGAGVKVGILSDSFDTGPGSYATDISTGDLAAGASILADSAGGTDEGRAMAQIVHDVAPGAAISFATANGGQPAFANNIRALANAGAKVIVDDVEYFAEPMFQDGVVAKAIDDVAAAGVVYVSAAGNDAHSAYSSAFVAGTAYSRQSFSNSPGAPRFRAGTSHDFDPGAGVDDKQAFTLAAGQTINISFQWDQPFFSVSGGLGCRSDMDIYVLDNANNRIVDAGNTNNIGGDAVETFQFTNNNSTSHDYSLLIVHVSGPEPGVMKYIHFDSVPFNEFSQPAASSLYGHSNAAGGAAVAASAFYLTPAFGFSPPFVEYFSSAGPSPILFNSSGNVITPMTRQQPRFTAPDGVNTSFFGQDVGNDDDSFPNFFGTSAAAPHAAAVAALLLQAKPGLSPAQVMAAMSNTALDMDEILTGDFDTGFDFRTGYGLIQADAAIRSITPTGSISGNVFIDRNSNGAFDPGEAGLANRPAFLDANNNSIIDLTPNTSSSSAVQSLGPTGIISAPIFVSGLAGLIADLNISFNVTHPNPAQLHPTLISPAGSRINLNLSANPQPVPIVRGENPNGTWRLEIIDNVPGTAGTLNNWSLNFTTGDISAVADSTGHYAFPHLEPAAYTLRANTPTDYIRISPPSGSYSPTLAAGAAISSQNFGFFPTRFHGTAGDDTFSVHLDDTRTRLSINDYNISKSLITSLAFETGDGNDTLSVDLDSADLLHLNYDSGGGSNSLIVSGGQINLDTAAALSSNLTIDVASANAMLILSSAPEERDALLSQINRRLRIGGNRGAWNGAGINSSGAAADPLAITGLAAVGAWQFDSNGLDDILIKLTRNGDSNLDGIIDESDYARVDAAWNDPPATPSYFSGDFNYSSRLDADDLFLIDRAFSG